MKKILLISVLTIALFCSRFSFALVGCGPQFLSDKGGYCLGTSNMIVDTAYPILSFNDNITFRIEVLAQPCSFQIGYAQFYKNDTFVSNGTSIFQGFSFQSKGYGKYTCISGAGNTTIYLMPPTATSINQIDNSVFINLFPNPNNGSFNLVGLEIDNIIQIIDISGRLVHEATANNYNMPLDLTSLNKGVYFYKVSENEKKKILKQGKVVLN